MSYVLSEPKYYIRKSSGMTKINTVRSLYRYCSPNQKKAAHDYLGFNIFFLSQLNRWQANKLFWTINNFAP